VDESLRHDTILNRHTWDLSEIFADETRFLRKQMKIDVRRGLVGLTGHVPLDLVVTGDGLVRTAVGNVLILKLPKDVAGEVSCGPVASLI